jgi:hypothetical protein
MRFEVLGEIAQDQVGDRLAFVAVRLALDPNDQHAVAGEIELAGVFGEEEVIDGPSAGPQRPGEKKQANRLDKQAYEFDCRLWSSQRRKGGKERKEEYGEQETVFAGCGGGVGRADCRG